MPVNRRRTAIAEPRRRVLTPDETARQLRLTIKELAQLRQRGEGPAFVTLTRSSVRYLRSSVNEWEVRNSQSAEPLSA